MPAQRAHHRGRVAGREEALLDRQAALRRGLGRRPVRPAQHDDDDVARVGEPAQLGEELPAVETWHEEIEDHRARSLAALEVRERVGPVLDGDDAVALELEDGAERIAGVGVILDQEHEAAATYRHTSDEDVADRAARAKGAKNPVVIDSRYGG